MPVAVPIKGSPDVFVANGTATSFTLRSPAASVDKVVVVQGGSTSFAATEYTVVSTTPAAGQVEFTGTPDNPAQTITFSAAPANESLILVTYTPAGAL